MGYVDTEALRQVGHQLLLAQEGLLPVPEVFAGEFGVPELVAATEAFGLDAATRLTGDAAALGGYSTAVYRAAQLWDRAEQQALGGKIR